MKRFKSLNSTSEDFKRKSKGSFDQSMLELGIVALQPKKRKTKYAAYTGCSSK